MDKAESHGRKGITESQAKAHKKYMSNFVEVKVRMTPQRRSEIQAIAASKGKSTTAFINEAIDKLIGSYQR